MNKAKIGYQRISSIIQNDKKLATSYAVSEILKADIINLIKNYFTIYENTADVQIDVQEQNDMTIYFAVKASRIKEFFVNQV